jgi:Xaa-Pro aminopeptidase
MVFVLHTQWLEPQSAGCNVGDLYVVTPEVRTAVQKFATEVA